MTDGESRAKTDEELVILTLEDQDCFLYLMQRYRDKLLSYIQRISGVSRDEAEDVLQEVFIKVYANLNGFDQSLKFSSWIYRITHNEVISNYRKKKARPQQVIIDDRKILENIADDFDINTKFDLDYLKKVVIKVMSKLDEKYREVLVLRFFEGKNYREISDILKKSIGTVSTLINRAKKEFKKELELASIEI